MSFWAWIGVDVGVFDRPPTAGALARPLSTFGEGDTEFLALELLRLPTATGVDALWLLLLWWLLVGGPWMECLKKILSLTRLNEQSSHKTGNLLNKNNNAGLYAMVNAGYGVQD